MAKRVLIVSASMGAGHNGAARELERRLSDRGHEATVVDFLDCLPFGIGTLMPVLYEMQLRLAPWAYEATYRLWYLFPFVFAPLGAFINLMTGRRVRRWVREANADVVISTYPMASLVLGRARPVAEHERVQRRTVDQAERDAGVCRERDRRVDAADLQRTEAAGPALRVA